MSVNRQKRSKCKFVLSNREYRYWNEEWYDIYWDEGMYSITKRKNWNKPRRSLLPYQYRMYRSWKYNRYVQYK